MKKIAVLFDFDGVVMDTEKQYSIFWHKVGVDYLSIDNLELLIKGQTLTYIHDKFFPGKEQEQKRLPNNWTALNSKWTMNMCLVSLTL